MDINNDTSKGTSTDTSTRHHGQSASAPTSHTDIVVGFDGTEAAEGAIDWAAHEAARRGVDLRIVTANPYIGLPFSDDVAGSVPPVGSLSYAEEVVAEGRLRAAKVLDESRISTVAVTGGAAQALVGQSRSAALVVVGHPARSRARELVTGSVAFAVATHAESDVALIPRGEFVLPGTGRPVVVGVDGARDGELAAERAADIAARWHAPLEIVCAWRMTSVAGWPEALIGTDIAPDRDYFEREAHASVARTAEAVRDAHPGLTVRTIVIEDQPASALTDIGANAGLVVVGTRGLGGLERLLLGSVSRAVLHHAVSPVLVVRP